MARIKKERKEKVREDPNDAIFTKFDTIVDLIHVMAYAHLGCYRLKGGHSAAVHNLPFSHDFNVPTAVYMFSWSSNTARLLQRLPDVSCLLPVVTTIFDFPFTLRSDRILPSSAMLPNHENIGINI